MPHSYACIYSQEMYMYISIDIIRNVYVHQYIHPTRCMCTPLVACIYSQDMYVHHVRCLLQERCMSTPLVACMYTSRHVCTSCEMTPTREMYVYTSCSMYVLSRHVCTSCEMTPTGEMYVYTSCNMYVHYTRCTCTSHEMYVYSSCSLCIHPVYSLWIAIAP